MSRKVLGEKAIINRLNKYFSEHYGTYEETANWYPDNTMTIWRCDIWQLGKTIILNCDSVTGIVTETTKNMSQEEIKKQAVPQEETDYGEWYISGCLLDGLKLQPKEGKVIPMTEKKEDKKNEKS